MRFDFKTIHYQSEAVLRQRVECDLQDLRECFETLEQLLTGRREIINRIHIPSEYQEKLRKYQESERPSEADLDAKWNELQSNMRMDLDDLELRYQKFGQMLRYSFFVYLYATLEARLYDICCELGLWKKLPSQRQGMLFEAKRGLSGHLNVPEILWQNVELLNPIRRCIVHSGGRVERDRDESKLRELAGRGVPPGYTITQKIVSRRQDEGWPSEEACQSMKLAAILEVIKAPDMIELREGFLQWSLHQVQSLFQKLFEEAKFPPFSS